MRRILVMFMIWFLLVPVTFVSAENDNLSESTVTYDDYVDGQYWSQDMLWAIQNDIVRGFQSEMNGVAVSELRPYGELTEAQLMTVLFRYMKPTELNNTVPSNPNFFASSAYQLAALYGLPTKGSLNNTIEAHKETTRGVLAQNLASLYFGKTVSMKQAVQFMYDTGASLGIGDGAKTYENYGVDTNLKRAHIVSFIKRYDDFVKSGRQVQLSNPSSDAGSGSGLTIAPSGNQVVGSITVRYGSHTYASNNQAEYDAVMNAVDDAIKNFSLREHFGDERYGYYQEYMNGARSNSRDRNIRNITLRNLDSTLGDLFNAGLSKEQVEIGFSTELIANTLFENATDPLTGAPESAYDAIVRNITDCDASAQVQSAVFDALGMNTTIMAKPGHANFYFEVNGKWFFYALNGGWSDFTNQASQGFKSISQPTDGSIINADGTITRY